MNCYPHQFDFKLKSIIENIQARLDDNEIDAVIFVGLKKAFDTVDHKIFIRKLEHYGLKGIEKDWFCSYLTNRKQLYRLIAITLQFR